MPETPSPVPPEARGEIASDADEDEVSLDTHVEVAPDSSPEQIDTKWVERARKAFEFGELSLIAPANAKEMKRQFLLDSDDPEYVENPQFEYAETDIIEKKETELLELKEAMLSDEETHPAVVQLYRYRINERLAQLRMGRMSREAEAETDPVKKERLDRRFHKYSKFVYGEPNEQEAQLQFDETYERLQWYREQDYDGASDEVKALYDQVLGSDFFASSAERYDPEAAAFRRKAEVEGENAENLSAAEFKEVCRNVIEDYDFDDRWRVVDAKGSTMQVHLFAEGGPEVHVPLKDRNVRSAKELIAHELETHVLRAESGKRSKLGLLELGLDRYLTTEEGLATYQQQQVHDPENRQVSGLWPAFAASLAKDMNFRDTFEALAAVQTLFNSHTESDFETAQQNARNGCWITAKRTFRGIADTSKPGHYFTKDWVYRKGNAAIWDVVDNQGEEALKRLYIGKVGVHHLEMSLWDDLDIDLDNPPLEPRKVWEHIEDFRPESQNAVS